MLRSSLSAHSDVYTFVTGTITTEGAQADNTAKQADERNKGVIFKYCAPFSDCINKNN